MGRQDSLSSALDERQSVRFCVDSDSPFNIYPVLSSREKLAARNDGCFSFNSLKYYEKLKCEFFLLNLNMCLLLIFENKKYIVEVEHNRYHRSPYFFFPVHVSGHDN